MFDKIEQIPYHRAVFFIFVLFVFGTSTYEILTEFGAGETLGTMGDDLSWFALSGIVLGLFIIEHLIQKRALGQLRGQLDKARGQLAQIDSNSRRIGSEFRDVMQKQFNAWHLTTSEQNVVLGLLKGFTFREIAELRETREKTVRQQASSVYRKAGVASRNELAAWFFEDMLEPPVFDNSNFP